MPSRTPCGDTFHQTIPAKLSLRKTLARKATCSDCQWRRQFITLAIKSLIIHHVVSEKVYAVFFPIAYHYAFAYPWISRFNE